MNTSKKLSNNHINRSAILIAEDDPDQKELLVDIIVTQIKRTRADENLSEEQKEKLTQIQILSVSNTQSLKHAAKKQDNVMLTILDCNMPDKKGGVAHDQFIKTNHRITGQHTSADIVTKYLPGTPITMISSLNRFQKIISLYYKKKLDVDINFISKKDPDTIKRNVRYYLRQFLK